jgi:hypothetical protein
MRITDIQIPFSIGSSAARPKGGASLGSAPRRVNARRATRFGFGPRVAA